MKTPNTAAAASIILAQITLLKKHGRNASRSVDQNLRAINALCADMAEIRKLIAKAQRADVKQSLRFVMDEYRDELVAAREELVDDRAELRQIVAESKQLEAQLASLK